MTPRPDRARDVLALRSPFEPDETAERTLTKAQQAVLIAFLAGSLFGGWTGGVLGYVTGVIGVITIAYFVVLVFKFNIAFRSARSGSIKVPADELAALREDTLPAYSILVPLYNEGRVLAQLVRNLSALDYPRNKLQILLLVEADDVHTRWIADRLLLPSNFEIVEVPVSHPRTKPKACNIGLTRVRGQYCVIYDAEDRPEPDQLRKAVVAFGKVKRNVVCIQAKLQYWNPRTNFLTRFFSAEYASYFNLVLPGLGTLALPVPLGGTSNHFRTVALQELGGWDPYNVTEDIDIGMRLARLGWAVEVLDSITWEEANSHLGNWLRQRSRWIKGHMQTYFVHMRSPRRLFAELGAGGFLSFQVTVGGTPLMLLLNPLFWALTLTYILTGSSVINRLYPPTVFYLGVICMILGNFVFLYYTMTGAMLSGLYGNVKWMFLSPIYWILMSAAAWKALGQLILRPHYWEKTDHGLVREEVESAQAGVAADGVAAGGARGSPDR